MTAVLMLLARSLLDWELALGRLVLWRCTPAAATHLEVDLDWSDECPHTRPCCRYAIDNESR